jgi:hypothetical protein
MSSCVGWHRHGTGLRKICIFVLSFSTRVSTRSQFLIFISIAGELSFLVGILIGMLASIAAGDFPPPLQLAEIRETHVQSK